MTFSMLTNSSAFTLNAQVTWSCSNKFPFLELSVAMWTHRTGFPHVTVVVAISHEAVPNSCDPTDYSPPGSSVHGIS